MGLLENIEYFAVLMLENRSFDNLLGTLYPKSTTFEGLDPGRRGNGRSRPTSVLT